MLLKPKFRVTAERFFNLRITWGISPPEVKNIGVDLVCEF